MSTGRETFERMRVSAESKLADDPSSLDRQSDVNVAIAMLRDYDRENPSEATAKATPAGP